MFDITFANWYYFLFPFGLEGDFNFYREYGL